MAYRKKYTKRTKATSGRRSASSYRSKKPATRRKAPSRAVQTVRIVIEDRQGLSPSIPFGQKAGPLPRKARF